MEQICEVIETVHSIVDGKIESVDIRVNDVVVIIWRDGDIGVNVSGPEDVIERESWKTINNIRDKVISGVEDI